MGDIGAGTVTGTEAGVTGADFVAAKGSGAETEEAFTVMPEAVDSTAAVDFMEVEADSMEAAAMVVADTVRQNR